MARRPRKRRYNVALRNGAGRLAPGAAFKFRLDGELAGEALAADGRADVTLGVRPDEVLEIEVAWGDWRDTAKIAFDQQGYTFTLPAELAPPAPETPDASPDPPAPDPAPARPAVPGPDRPPPRMARALFAVGALLLASGGAAALLASRRPAPAPPDPVEAAAERIARHCAAGQQTSEQGRIAAGLAQNLTKLAGEATVTSSSVGAIASRLAPTDAGARMYEIYTTCLRVQMELELKRRGVEVQSAPSGASAATRQPPGAAGADTPSVPAADAPQGSPSGAAGPASAGAIAGWSYYEELDGAPTRDGVLMPIGRPAPRYTELQVGDVLRSRRGFKIRRAPSSLAEMVGDELDAGKCVRVVAPPERPVEVREARSGGYLKVQTVRCP